MENYLTKLSISIAPPPDSDFKTIKSSLFHGVISESISPDYANELHRFSIHPYSQYLCKRDSSWFWVINTLNNEAKEQIIEPLSKQKRIYLRHNDMEIKLENKVMEQTTINDMFIDHGLDSSAKKTEFSFITPTAFKSNGNYVNMPTVQLILQSIIQKYDAFSGNTIYNENLMNEIAQRVFISSYSLKSSYFPLEGIRIPAFTGSLTLYVKGGGALPGIVRMLGEYSKYSGIGIKTALGMGAIEFKTRGEANG